MAIASPRHFFHLVPAGRPTETSQPTLKRFLLASASAWLVTTAAGQDADIDAWARKLGSDDPAIRLEAEQAIAPPRAILEQLAKHRDPWTAARATRLLMKSHGIDTRLPLRFQQAVFGFNQLDQPRRSELLRALTGPGPGHLHAVAFLFNRLPAFPPDEEMMSWRGTFYTCLRDNMADMETLKAEDLAPTTLAMILGAIPEGLPEIRARQHACWRPLHPSIRRHLPNDYVDLEIAYLKEHGGAVEMLEFLPLIKDEQTRMRATRMVADTVKRLPAPPEKELAGDALIGQIMVVMASKGTPEALACYQRHFASRPDLATKLPTELTFLETRRMLKAGETAAAIRLAVSPNQDGFGPEPADHETLHAMAAALGSLPQNLPDGLPAIGNPQSLEKMGRLLAGWVPPASVDLAAKAECFDQWAKSDEWLEAARRHGPLPLYHLVLTRRGKLNDAVVAHEFDHESEAMRSLGAILPHHPELAKVILPRQCSPT